MTATEATTHIVIIGGGTSGTSTLDQLAERAGRSSVAARVTLVEPRSPGGGLAFGPGPDCHILNLAASVMSLDPEDPLAFVRWMQDDPVHHAHVGVEYPPRWVFGRYVADAAHDALARLWDSGWTAEVVTGVATGITSAPGGRYRVALDAVDGSDATDIADADVVVLALGHLPADCSADLAGLPNYVISPYTGVDLDPNATVAVLGSRLSAIDVALVRHEAGHPGRTILASRSGRLPSIIGPSQPYEPTVLTRALVDGLAPDSLDLEDVLALLQAEVDHATGQPLAWAEVLAPAPTSAASFLTELELVERGHNRPWQSVLIAIYPLVPALWQALTDAGRTDFLATRYSTWMTYLAAFPLPSARRIGELFRTDRLTVRGGLRDVQPTAQGWTLDVGDGCPLDADVLVDGTGPGYDVTRTPSPLLRSLLDRGLAAPSPWGGLEVDDATLRVLPTERPTSTRAASGIFAVGDLTRGRFLATADVGQSVRQTTTLGNHLLDLITRSQP